jgi:hypothetical protein
MLTTLNVTPPPDMPCERIVAKPPASPREAPEKPAFPWGVQLIGDRSEMKALATYRALQKKHEAILGEYQPTIVRTTLKTTTGRSGPAYASKRIVGKPPRPFALACARPAKLVLCSATEARFIIREPSYHSPWHDAGGSVDPLTDCEWRTQQDSQRSRRRHARCVALKKTTHHSVVTLIVLSMSTGSSLRGGP